MSKMVPSEIPEMLLNDPKRRAERQVYQSLDQELGGDFTVYWSRPWHRFRPDGTGRDGEVDFVVAHASFGVLALEVKGGRVSCNDQGQWVSVSSSGTPYNLKRSPVAQAMEGKYELIKRLKQVAALSKRHLNICHGVVLPDNSRPAKALGADAPLELFAFGNEIGAGKLGDWVRETLMRGANACDPLGPEGMKALHEIIAAEFELRPHLASALAHDMKKIELLTAEQAYVLESLAGNPQMAIAGAAGTGKTLLALEKAMRCAKAGDRTLLTCFNNALAAHLKGLVGEVENLTIAGFHELCGKVAHQAKVSVPDLQGPVFYSKTLPNALEQAMQARPDLAYDAIIVDEGQDFDREWYDTLRLSLKDMDASTFHVFFDDNQRIYGGAQSFVDELPKLSFRLIRNLRNTRAIHRCLTPWYDARGAISAGPAGQPVDWIEVKSKEQAYTNASAFVADLIKTAQLQASDIAILTGGARDKCGLFSHAQIGGAVPISASDLRGKNRIWCDTARRFKGLEAKCVVLVDIDQLIDDELIYVALSRPSLLLRVIGLPADILRLKGGLGR